MLLFVIFSCTFTLVFGLNSGSLSVAFLEVGIDIFCDAIYLLLQRREALNLIGVHLS
jgi:hypothetical protein